MRALCGLDFGTSNSTFSVLQNGAPRLLPLEGDRPTIPSTVFFSFEDNGTYFGRKAIAEYVEGADGRMMRALKSVLGTALIGDRVRIRQQSFLFTDIIGMFVRELRSRAETALDEPVERIVAGRPVQFVDDDAAADRAAQDQLEAALRAQGFSEIAFQYEPIAAALDYERQVSGEELVLIVDLGGGTSDFSVVRVSPERARAAERHADILSTAGVHIGGTDFDRLLSLAKVMPLLGYRTMTADGKRVLPSGPFYDFATWHRINRLYNPKTLAELKSTRNEAAEPDLVDDFITLVSNRQGHNLAGVVEAAKIALSDEAEIDFRFADHEVALRTPITQADLVAALDHAVDRIIATASETLQRAGVSAEAIETVILTGGSTQLPVVAQRLEHTFVSARFVRTDVLGSVGLGLAIDAGRKFGP